MATSSFRASWEFQGKVSWITVQITAEDDGARLLLEHTADTPHDFWRTYGPGATGVGWELAFLGLALHLATDRSTPPESSGWERSEDARVFIAGHRDDHQTVCQPGEVARCGSSSPRVGRTAADAAWGPAHLSRVRRASP